MFSNKFSEFGEDHISFVRNSTFKNNVTVGSGGAFM